MKIYLSAYKKKTISDGLNQGNYYLEILKSNYEINDIDEKKLMLIGEFKFKNNDDIRDTYLTSANGENLSKVYKYDNKYYEYSHIVKLDENNDIKKEKIRSMEIEKLIKNIRIYDHNNIIFDVSRSDIENKKYSNKYDTTENIKKINKNLSEYMNNMMSKIIFCNGYILEEVKEPCLLVSTNEERKWICETIHLEKKWIEKEIKKQNSFIFNLTERDIMESIFPYIDTKKIDENKIMNDSCLDGAPLKFVLKNEKDNMIEMIKPSMKNGSKELAEIYTNMIKIDEKNEVELVEYMAKAIELLEKEKLENQKKMYFLMENIKILMKRALHSSLSDLKL